MTNKDTPETLQGAFAPLSVSDVALLTTFRRNGKGVGTPVGIKIATGKLYFTTWSTTGKVKRLARNPRVTLAPFTKMVMKAIGSTVAGMARRLEGPEAEYVSTNILKQSLWGRLWGLIYKLRGWQPVLYEVTPLPEELAKSNAPTTIE